MTLLSCLPLSQENMIISFAAHSLENKMDKDVNRVIPDMFLAPNERTSQIPSNQRTAQIEIDSEILFLLDLATTVIKREKHSSENLP